MGRWCRSLIGCGSRDARVPAIAARRIRSARAGGLGVLASDPARGLLLSADRPCVIRARRGLLVSADRPYVVRARRGLLRGALDRPPLALGRRLLAAIARPPTPRAPAAARRDPRPPTPRAPAAARRDPRPPTPRAPWAPARRDPRPPSPRARPSPAPVSDRRPPTALVSAARRARDHRARVGARRSATGGTKRGEQRIEVVSRHVLRRVGTRDLERRRRRPPLPRRWREGHGARCRIGYRFVAELLFRSEQGVEHPPPHLLAREDRCAGTHQCETNDSAASTAPAFAGREALGLRRLRELACAACAGHGVPLYLGRQRPPRGFSSSWRGASREPALDGRPRRAAISGAPTSQPRPPRCGKQRAALRARRPRARLCVQRRLLGRGRERPDGPRAVLAAEHEAQLLRRAQALGMVGTERRAWLRLGERTEHPGAKKTIFTSGFEHSGARHDRVLSQQRGGDRGHQSIPPPTGHTPTSQIGRIENRGGARSLQIPN